MDCYPICHSTPNLIASIYEKYYDEVKRYLRSYTHDEMDAEDLLQDLFLKVMKFDIINEETAKNLLIVMARRMAIDYVRHKSFIHRREQDLSAMASIYDRDSLSRKVEVADLLSLERQHLSKMAPKRAQVYELYRHQEFSALEIAQMLHLSKRTVETHIYLSSKEMRQYLQKSM